MVAHAGQGDRVLVASVSLQGPRLYSFLEAVLDSNNCGQFAGRGMCLTDNSGRLSADECKGLSLGALHGSTARL